MSEIIPTLPVLENSQIEEVPSSSQDFDFELPIGKACLINDPDCESCQ